MNLTYHTCGLVKQFLFCLQDELSDVIDIKNPDQTPVDERRKKRLAAEAAKFDPDHYLWVSVYFTRSRKSTLV